MVIRVVMIQSAAARIIETRESLWLRVVCFLICIPSIGALLAKVYGVASMRAVTLAVALPCCAGLVGVWVWACRSGKEQLASRLAIGFVGGLLGTIAYDVVRLPFALAGQLVFAPISTFGVWIADANSSSRFTEVIGWLYHYSNGITFGVMYALFMRGRHWAWAILWACALETISLVSPFGRIFYLSGNYSAMAIAYLGHVGYGLPLGWLVNKWDDTTEQLAEIPGSHKWIILIIGCGLFAWPMISPGRAWRDTRAAPGEFRVEGNQLNPDFLRIKHDTQIQVFNPGANTISVRVKQNNVTTQVAGNHREALSFPKPGMYQVFVETDRRSQSSFVIVEPVEEFR